MLGGVITFFLLKVVNLPYPLAALVAILIVILIGFYDASLSHLPLAKGFHSHPHHGHFGVFHLSQQYKWSHLWNTAQSPSSFLR